MFLPLCFGLCCFSYLLCAAFGVIKNNNNNKVTTVANEVMEMKDDIRHVKDDVNDKTGMLEGKFESMTTDQVTKTTRERKMGDRHKSGRCSES